MGGEKHEVNPYYLWRDLNVNIARALAVKRNDYKTVVVSTLYRWTPQVVVFIEYSIGFLV